MEAKAVDLVDNVAKGVAVDQPEEGLSFDSVVYGVFK